MRLWTTVIALFFKPRGKWKNRFVKKIETDNLQIDSLSNQFTSV